MKNSRGLLLGVAVLLALQSILSASMVQLGDKDLFQQAESVIIGRVERVASQWDADLKNIYSDITVFVEYQFKGNSLERYRTFRVPGGRVGDIIQEVSEMPSFNPGERVLLFLGDKVQPIIGGLQGKAQLVGNRIVGREMTVEEFAAKMAEIQPIRQGVPLPSGQTSLLTPFEFEQCTMPKNKMRESVQNITSNRTTSTSTIFSDGFEAGFPTGQWTRSSGSNGYTWGAENYNPYAGSYTVWCAGASLNGQPDLNPATNNYANSMNAWMRWGPFDLSDAVSAQMTFYLWLESESGYDYFKWGSSIDGNAFAMYKTSGQTSGWMQLTLDLSSRVGQSQVWIAFNFTSSVSNTFKGAFVDEIVISKTLPNASSPVIYNITPGKASAGTNTQVTITGNNFGNIQGNGCVEFFYRADQPKIKAPIISWSNTTIVCTVPVDMVNGYPASASSGPVTVTTNEGQTSLGYDFIVSFGYGQRKWNTNNVPFFINENLASMSGEGDAVRNAAETWTYVGTANFSLTFAGYCNATSASYNGKNEITWAALGSNGIVAQASCWFNTNGIILENDIVFNTSYAWGIGQGNFYDIETIALHELGHWLNLRDLYGDLGDNNNDRAKVMYGFGVVNSIKRSLHPDDRDGIQYIYQQAPVFDDSWDTRELDISAVQAQIKAAQGYTQGTAAVYNEVSPLVTNQRSLRRWWAMHALDHAMIRLYFTPSMLVEANFSGNPVIYHYDGEAWRAIATSPTQVEGDLLYVESIEPVTSWSPFALFDAGPIAVNLTSFAAQETAAGVELVWQAAQEINIAGYDIQRRTEQEKEWLTVASWTTEETLRTWPDATDNRLYHWIDSSAPRQGQVFYRIRAVSLNGLVEGWNETTLLRLSAAVDNAETAPTTFAVYPAFPNPFNACTTIAFDLPNPSFTQITVLDVSGRVVEELFNGHLSAGRHHIRWNADRFASGVYMICLKAGTYFNAHRVLLVK